MQGNGDVERITDGSPGACAAQPEFTPPATVPGTGRLGGPGGGPGIRLAGSTRQEVHPDRG